MQIRPVMQRIAAKPAVKTAAKVAGRVGVTALAAGAYLFGPHLLGMTSENFNPGLVDSLVVGAGIGLGKLTKRVWEVSFIGLWLFGPVTACTIFPLAAIMARFSSKSKHVNQIV